LAVNFRVRNWSLLPRSRYLQKKKAEYRDGVHTNTIVGGGGVGGGACDMLLQARRGVEYANRPESSDCDQTFSLESFPPTSWLWYSSPYRQLCTYSCVAYMLGLLDKARFARVSPPLTSFSEWRGVHSMDHLAIIGWTDAASGAWTGSSLLPSPPPLALGDPSPRVAASGMSDREPDSNDGSRIWKQRPKKCC